MCGIVGAFGPGYTLRDTNFIRQSLITDMLRGMDSTGIAQIKTDGDVKVVKAAMHAVDFLDMRRTDSVIGTVYKVWGILGHNRKATAGVVNKFNAHPFQHDHITMVHNGTLRGTYKDITHGTFSVDSEYICHALAHQPAKQVAEKLEGAFAVMWFDSKAGTLNAFRNEERPLYYAYAKDGRTVYFNSEYGGLYWMLTRNGISFEKIEAVEPAKLYSWDMDKFGKPRVSDLNFKKEEINRPFSQPLAGPAHRGPGVQYATNTTPVGSKVFFTFQGWAPSQNGGSGTLQGECMASGNPVRVNNIKRKLVAWDAVYCSGTVTGSSSSGTRTTLFLDAKSITVLEKVSHYITLVSKPEKGQVLALPDRSRESTPDRAVTGSPPYMTDIRTNQVMVYGPDDEYITKEEWDELTGSGCVACDAELHIEDANRITWHGDVYPLCYKCSLRYNAFDESEDGAVLSMIFSQH